MKKLYYDFHIHSCLSPCAEEDMTPANIAGMAVVKGLDVIAVTDHNSCKNCRALFYWAEKYGILALAGIELTTMEEVHVLCLFAKLEQAERFDQYVHNRLLGIKNKKEIFGTQYIMNEKDERTGEEELLLIQATNISFLEVFELVQAYEGIMIPAHIDKKSHSLLSQLGFIPSDSRFLCAEIKDLGKTEALRNAHTYLRNCKIIHNSDAHYLTDIQEAEYQLEVTERTKESVLKALYKME